MIALDKFTEADFDRLISWVASEKDLIQFAGPIFKYPLSHFQLSNYLKESKKMPFRVRIVETGKIIGHCELNFENDIPRLSRILIGEKQLRNQGFGKLIIIEMIKIIFSSTEFQTIDLNVFDWNLNAIACYQKLGFTIRSERPSSMTIGEDVWEAHNMILNKGYFVHTL